MYNRQIINEMLHYMKSGKNVIYDYVNKKFEQADKWCPFLHGEKTKGSCYRNNEELQYLILFLKRYVLCFEYLEIYSYDLKELNKNIMNLESPEINSSLNIFKINLKRIILIIKKHEDKIFKEINKLTCQECIRLDEAITVFSNDCFFSSIIMSVSAIESRFHYILEKKNKKLYKKYFEKSTLGQIIKVFDKNEYKDKEFKSFKQILPEEYEHIVKVLNTYRVFSAHPKAKEVEYKTAQSILNFSFNLLLNDELKIEEKLMKCK